MSVNYRVVVNELILLLKKFFGYTSFRPLQAEIIGRILQKKDSLVLMPTGGGKSICYQLPAVYLPGTAVVISPLIALMKDQVESLRANGIPAVALNSTMSEAEQQQAKLLCRQGRIKLLYISPERVKMEADWFLPNLDISLIAIDEAHCISQWGHDFRPEYTQLAILKERFPQVPIVALTATADKTTRQDILQQLNLVDPQIFISSFDRPNLSFEVRQGLSKREKLSDIVRFIRQHNHQSGIIYCMKRDDTEMLATYLQSFSIPATAYHAGLTALARERAQDDFINDRVEVVCATVAFGMGIDKSNVRWVIHYNMPRSMENYYQEVGRAGRDGLKSDTLLFYSLGDLKVLSHFVEESGQKELNREKLELMQRYCESDVCRRRVLLSYFGEETQTDCGNCDICRNPPQRFDGTILVQKALSAVIRAQERVGMQLLIFILRGQLRAEVMERGYDRLKTFGAGRDLSFRAWKSYLFQMLHLGYLEVDYMNGMTLKVTTLGRKVLYGEQKALLAVYVEPDRTIESGGSRNKPKAQPIRPLATGSVDATLSDALYQLRKQIAQRESMPAYIIFSDASLEDMVEKKPITIEAFGEIKGVGQIKQAKYGRVFVSLIRFILKLPKLS